MVFVSTIWSANYSQEIGLHGDSCSDALSGDDLTIGEAENLCTICLLPMAEKGG